MHRQMREWNSRRWGSSWAGLARMRVAAGLASIGMMVAEASGSPYTRLDTAVSLDQAGAWSTGGPPTSADVALWDATCMTAANCTNGAASNINLNWGGIQNAGGNPGTNVVIPSSGTSTLTLNGSGIDWSYTNATRNLTIACPLIIGAAQNWKVAVGRTVAVSNNVDTTAGHLLAVNGPGNVTVSGSLSGSGGILVSNATTTTLTLSGDNSGWSGELTIVTGKVVVTTSANALGTTAGATTVVGTGGQLDVQTTNVPENVAIRGTGIGNNGALVNSAAVAASVTGTVTLVGDCRIGVNTSGGLLTLGGKVTGTGQMIKLGTGVLILANNANDYTNVTSVIQGVVRLGAANALGAVPGNLSLNGGIVEGTASYASFAQTLGAAAGQLQVPGGVSGFSANGAPVTVNLTPNGGSAGDEIQWGSTYFKPTTLVLNETTANNGLTFQNPLDLNAGTRSINVNAGTATVSSVIRTASGTAGLTKGGNGTLRLQAQNSTYTSNTTINAGMVEVTKLANAGVASSLGAPTLAYSTNVIGSGTTGAGLRFIGTGDQSTDRVINMAGTTGGVTLDASGAGTITFAGNIVAGGNGAKTLTLDGTGTGTISGAIADYSPTVFTAVTKTGPGTWALTGSNTYSGVTRVQNGMLSLGNGVLNANAFLIVEGGAVKLDFAGTNIVACLVLGGMRAVNGVTYGGPGSGADITNAYLTGSGKLLQAGAVRYVDCAASGTGDGLSWSTAYQNLSNALVNASDGLIYWVAQGTYTNGTVMVAKPYVAIYGGFTNGMAIFSQRNWTGFPTVADGMRTNRCFYNTATNMVLDGFTVQNGVTPDNGAGLYCPSGNVLINNCLFHTNRTSSAIGQGAALYLGAGSHLLSGCVFSNNLAGGEGGALRCDGSLMASNCDFVANTAGNGYRGGGAVVLYQAGVTNTYVGCRFIGNRDVSGSGGYGSGGAIQVAATDASRPPLVVLQGCEFRNNSAGHGGAISLVAQNSAPVYGYVQCRDCVFSNNTGTAALYATSGGAFLGLTRCDLVGNTRALYSFCNTWATNCSFIANSGASGGAVNLVGASTNLFMNCTFLTNRATAGQGGAILSTNTSAVLSVANCIFWNNRSTGTGTNIQNGGTLNLAYCDIATNGSWVAGGTLNYGAGIIDTDPLFASAVPPYDVHLKSHFGRWYNEGWVMDAVTSPCIDAGDPAADYSREPRPSEGIELGAYGNTPQASLSRQAGTVLWVN